jgi:HSP20 family protein
MQIERWMDIFSDDEPDLMGLELVREFDIMAKRFYDIFDNDGLNEWAEPSEICVDIVLDSSYSVARPNKNAKVRKVETVPVSDKTVEPRIEKVEQDSSEDVIVSDKNIKIAFQLPINNTKENIKVVANDDCSITISNLNNQGDRCTRTLEIPDSIDSDTAKATYKNGILEITFDRQ